MMFAMKMNFKRIADKSKMLISLNRDSLSDGPYNNQLALVENELNKYLLKNPRDQKFISEIVQSDFLFHQLYIRLSEERFSGLVTNGKSQWAIKMALFEMRKSWSLFLKIEKENKMMIAERKRAIEDEHQNKTDIKKIPVNLNIGAF